MAIRVKRYPPGVGTHPRHSRAYLSVSLGNRLTATEAHLLEILRWLQQNVGLFDIVVGDYFHRHNIEDLEGLEPSIALRVAEERGSALAQRIQSVLDEARLAEVNIRCASSIVEKPEYLAALRWIEAAYYSDLQFARLIDMGTDTFLRRLAPNRAAVEAARSHSRLYQLEELAVFTLLADEGYSTNAYAGAHLPVMKAIVSGELKDITPALRKLELIELWPRSRSRKKGPTQVNAAKH